MTSAAPRGTEPSSSSASCPWNKHRSGAEHRQRVHERDEKGGEQGVALAQQPEAGEELAEGEGAEDRLCAQPARERVRHAVAPEAQPLLRAGAQAAFRRRAERGIGGGEEEDGKQRWCGEEHQRRHGGGHRAEQGEGAGGETGERRAAVGRPVGELGGQKLPQPVRDRARRRRAADRAVRRSARAARRAASELG